MESGETRRQRLLPYVCLPVCLPAPSFSNLSDQMIPTPPTSLPHLPPPSSTFLCLVLFIISLSTTPIFSPLSSIFHRTCHSHNLPPIDRSDRFESNNLFLNPSLQKPTKQNIVWHYIFAKIGKRKKRQSSREACWQDEEALELHF